MVIKNFQSLTIEFEKEGMQYVFGKFSSSFMRGDQRQPKI
jgi:hypothetical protein